MSEKAFFKIMAAGFFCAVLSISLFACKSTQQSVEEAKSDDADLGSVATYVNTSVNKADGKISTIMLFNSISEVVAIHPISRVRYNLSEADYKYDPQTTELRIVLPKSVPYKINELGFHIVGQAVNPGVFVLAGIDKNRGGPGVFFAGKKSVEGTDYSYDKASARITSLIPLNVDKDSFEICWATTNGEVTFSNNTQQYKEEYIRLYNEWSRSVHMRQ